MLALVSDVEFYSSGKDDEWYDCCVNGGRGDRTPFPKELRFIRPLLAPTGTPSRMRHGRKPVAR